VIQIKQFISQLITIIKNNLQNAQRGQPRHWETTEALSGTNVETAECFSSYGSILAVFSYDSTFYLLWPYGTNHDKEILSFCNMNDYFVMAVS